MGLSRTSRPDGRRDGFTLIEVSISTLLLTILLGSVILATHRGMGLFWQSSANNDINARATRTSYRLLKNLLSAGDATIMPDLTTPPGADTVWSTFLEYQQALDYAAGATVWGSTTRIAYVLASGELDNGADDNGNGLVDERQVVRFENWGDPDQQIFVVARGVSELLEGELPNGADDNGNGLVDESGLAFSLSDNTLTVHLSLERQGPDGRVIVRTQEASVMLRN